MQTIANFVQGRVMATIGCVFALLLSRADAQSLSSFYVMPTVEESLADEYGRAIVAELALLMTRRAEADCLKTNNLSEGSLKQRAGDILTRYGGRVLPLAYPDIDHAAVEAEQT